MSKAMSAKKLLALMGATGAVGVAGGGYAGHKMGVRSGAKRTANEMASAFSEANAKENQQLIDSFKAFNKRENQAIAKTYLKRGVALGAGMSKKSSLEGEEMDKHAALEEIYNEAFNAELEKLGYAGIVNAAKAGYQTLKRSFSNLGSGLKSMKSQALLKGTKGGKKEKLRKVLSEGAYAAKRSRAALGTVAGGTAAGAYALS